MARAERRFMRIHRIVFLIALAAALPALSGCADFDADKLDIFNLNEKKKLPGDRKAVFPEGVPGVVQGIPPEFVKGNQPPPETAQVIPPEPAKPAAKKTAAVDPANKPKRKPKPATAQQQQAPAGQPQQQQQQPWPEQGQQNQSTSSSGSAPW